MCAGHHWLGHPVSRMEGIMSQCLKGAFAIVAATLGLALAACTFQVESREGSGTAPAPDPSAPRAPDLPNEPLTPTAPPGAPCRLGEGSLVRLATYETRFTGAAAMASAGGSLAVLAEHEIGLLSSSPAGLRLDAVLSDVAGEATATARPRRSIAFAANGSRLAFSNGNGAVTVWDVARKSTIARLEPLAAGMPLLAFSDDGALLAVADATGAIRLWSPDTAEVVRAPQDLRAKVITFLPNQRDLLVAGNTLSGWSSIEVIQRLSHQQGFLQA